MNKKPHPYDYLNHRWWNSYKRLQYYVPWIHFKIQVRTFIWNRIRGLYNAITYPWWLIQYWYSLFRAFFLWLPKFIRSIPSIPRRLFFYLINEYKNIKQRVFTDHVYLRKRTLKRTIFFNFKISFVLYLFLSFIDEFKNYKNHHFAEVNKWWDLIFELGLDWTFCCCIIYTGIWLFSLYFIGWKYWVKTYGLYLYWVLYSALDLCAPDMTHEWVWMIIQTYHIPTYLFCSYYCWVLNDLVEYYRAVKPLPKYKFYSWEYDHFALRIQEEADDQIRKELQTTFKYIKLRDYENKWLGTL